MTFYKNLMAFAFAAIGIALASCDIATATRHHRRARHAILSSRSNGLAGATNKAAAQRCRQALDNAWHFVQFDACS